MPVDYDYKMKKYQQLYQELLNGQERQKEQSAGMHIFNKDNLNEINIKTSGGDNVFITKNELKQRGPSGFRNLGKIKKAVDLKSFITKCGWPQFNNYKNQIYLYQGFDEIVDTDVLRDICQGSSCQLSLYTVSDRKPSREKEIDIYTLQGKVFTFPKNNHTHLTIERIKNILIQL